MEGNPALLSLWILFSGCQYLVDLLSGPGWKIKRHPACGGSTNAYAEIIDNRAQNVYNLKANLS